MIMRPHEMTMEASLTTTSLAGRSVVSASAARNFTPTMKFLQAGVHSQAVECLLAGWSFLGAWSQPFGLPQCHNSAHFAGAAGLQEEQSPEENCCLQTTLFPGTCCLLHL